MTKQLEFTTDYGLMFIRTAERGEWDLTSFCDVSSTYNFSGWGGENIVTLMFAGTQASYIEAVVIHRMCDNPIQIFRVASNMEGMFFPETFMNSVAHLLETLMQDRAAPIHPESRAFSRNALEAIDRHRETCSGRKDEQSQSTLWSELV